ncbi:MAG: UvrD-helicase domain-containing protein, partial [Candidatus Ornithospirochaeta sp.]
MKNETKEKFLSFCLERHFDITSPDSRQREAVFSDDKFVIPAGAGSGKTTVLTYRFLRLLMDEDIAPIHSDEILTITFTKAATANMKSRIYRTLKSAEKMGLIPQEEVDRFSNAEISTTDSFCSKIVRMDSIRYGIAPDFSIEDEDDYNAWTKES